MRLKVLTLAIAFLSPASFAQAGRFEVAPRLGVFVPTGDADKQFESAVDAGITATYWYKSAAGIGLDLGYHRLPGSQSANRAADALLSGLAGAPITGSKWSWRGLQATPHVKTTLPALGSVLPWISVGAGLFAVEPDLDMPVDQLEAAGVEVIQGADRVEYNFGYVGGVGFDFGTSSRWRLGVDVSYQYMPAQGSVESDFTGLSIGARLLLGPR